MKSVMDTTIGATDLSGAVAIRIEGLGKQYRRTLAGNRSMYRTLRESIMDVATAPIKRLKAVRERSADAVEGSSEHFWALRDITFDVSEGEAVGIIGRNGAGKTTLLKLLSRITEPTEGSADMFGRVGSLLEVGTGFHPELSGRENVFLNGAILGMSKREIESKFDEIVAFAEIAEFIDTQVKHYSSGMYMRLAFSVAAHLEPEILLIDEVLAVGDVAFQAKCLGKMSDVTRGGRTVLFVSHNMAAINALCDRAVWIEGGRVRQIGPALEVTEACIRFLKESTGAEQRVGYQIDAEQLGRTHSGFAVTDCQLKNPSSPGIGSRTGEPLMISVVYRANAEFVSPAFNIWIKDMYGQPLIQLSTMPISGYNIESLHPHGRVELFIDSLPLVAGHYLVDVHFNRPRMGAIAKYENLLEFDVEPFDYYGSGFALNRSKGIFVVDHSWNHKDISALTDPDDGDESHRIGMW